MKATGADPDQEPPYAPPLLASASQGVPGGAVLWRVVVTSGGSKGNTYEILPQLATAAAQAVGKNMQADVFVDSDMFDIMDGVGWEEGARHLRAWQLVDELKALMRGKAIQDG